MEIPASAFGFWMFLVISSAFFGIAVYAFLTWRSVKGVRGFAYAMVTLSLAIITATFSISYSGNIIFIADRAVVLQVSDTRIPIQWLIAVQQGAWMPVVVFAFVLADLYAAQHNSHRSVTTHAYLQYARLRDGKRKEQDSENGGAA